MQLGLAVLHPTRRGTIRGPVTVVVQRGNAQPAYNSSTDAELANGQSRDKLGQSGNRYMDVGREMDSDKDIGR